METLYRGYVPTSQKRATIPFKGKSSNELLTLEEAQKFFSPDLRLLGGGQRSLLIITRPSLVSCSIADI